MKIKIFFLIFAFVIMGIIPVVSMGNASVYIKNEEENLNNDNLESQNSVLEGLLYAIYSEDLNTEVLKAFAVLFKGNLYKDKNSFDLEDKKIYISDLELKEKFSDDFSDIIEKIKDVIKETESIYIYCNNEIAFVPYSQCSSGVTFTDEKYDNLISVASPWDKLSKNHGKDSKCIGVSLDGIRFLTEYYDYKTALMWYLPKYEIK